MAEIISLKISQTSLHMSSILLPTFGLRVVKCLHYPRASSIICSEICRYLTDSYSDLEKVGSCPLSPCLLQVLSKLPPALSQ